MSRSEIRHSTKMALLDKVRRHDYGKYLLKASISRVRAFQGEDIAFEFPVTALIGPNGSGKSSILGAAGCAYKRIRPGRRSQVPSATLLKGARSSDRFLEHLGVDFQRRAPVERLARPRVQ